MADNTSTNLSKIERDELIAICEKLRGDSSDPSTQADINRLITFIRSRKYGLMFEKHEEEVDRLLKDHLPAFYDVEDKTIKTKDTEDCNFLLEGDNLHSLKLLEKTHKGKIDVIYIDPPYNTGNKDFIYADNMVGQDDGFRHSKWLSFMKERLEIARELLSNEGVIFISIDDNEQAQLKLLCDGIFGEENFITQFAWIASTKEINGEDAVKVLGANLGMFKGGFEYVLSYRKNNSFKFALQKSSTDHIESRITKNGNANSVLRLPAGLKMHSSLSTTFKGAVGGDSEKLRIINPEGAIFENGVLKNNIELEGPYASAGLVKKFLSGEEVIDSRGQRVCEIYFKNTGIPYMVKEKLGNIPTNIFSGYGDTSKWRAKLIDILGEKRFDYPKPTDLIKDIIKLHNSKFATVLDFFAGSGTTGQAVLELNQEDGGDRHFILCTNNENNICEEVTYQRLKTVITGTRPDGTKYSEGIKANLKYFKTDMVAFDDEELEEKLINSSECLMQLENSALLSSPEIDIAYCDEDLPDVFANKPNLKTLYILEDVLFNAEQTRYIESHNIEIKRIADCYYQGV